MIALELLVLTLFTTLTIAIVIPQAIRLWVTRDPSGVSLAGLLNGCVGYTAWVIYLSVQDQWVPALATALAGVVWGAMTVYVAIRVGLSGATLSSVAAYAVTLGGLATVSTSAFGIALSLGAVWSGLPSVAEAWRAQQISGISVGTWVLYVAESLAWLAWAIMEHDFIVGLYGALAALVGVAVLAAVVVRVEARLHRDHSRDLGVDSYLPAAA